MTPNPTPRPSSIDDDLGALLQRGSHEALAWMATHYSARLRRFLAPLLDDDSQVDDVVQDVFARAFHAAPSLTKWKSSVSAWVFRIAHNAAMDVVRSRRIHQRALIAIRQRFSHMVVESPLDNLERREFRLAFEEEVRKLPREFREAFLLREVEGLDYSEIAHISGSNEKTVSTRIFRARRQLRGRLAHWLEDDT